MSKQKTRDRESSRQDQARPGPAGGSAPEERDENPLREGDEVLQAGDAGAGDAAAPGEEGIAGPEPGAGGEEAESLAEERIGELEEALAAAEAQSEENWNQFLRARAELENAQRRAKKDVDHARRQGIEKMAADLLQVKDSLEMGVQAAQEGDADPQKLLEGTELTLKMLNQVMERFEIEEIDPRGERFDPEYHEAMAMQATNDQEPNTVVHVVQKGYRLQDRLLRPAMVMVAKQADGPPSGAGGRIDEQA